jgi:hypothetical protein
MSIKETGMCMKIRQITSLTLVLAMLVLSTSCGKSTAVNPNLPIHKTPDANLTPDLIPKESWGDWGKKNIRWIFTTALCVSYMGLGEWRNYCNKKAIKAAEETAEKARIKSLQAFTTATGIESKADNCYFNERRRADTYRYLF